jgi:TusA-related sulfurtransferase
MWPFSKKIKESSIQASSVKIVDGITEIDVRGQTCPGYLLAINNALDVLECGTEAKLLITYPPCGEDVKAWCKEKKIEYLGLSQEEGLWIINIKK